MLKQIAFGVTALQLAIQVDAIGVHVNPSSRMIEDMFGRSLLFHGVNAIYKLDPYIPTIDGPFDSDNSLNAEDIQNLQDWGMNFVRLGVMWEAVEREPGVYDDAYLDKVEVLINRLGEAGIYTLVDMHQDVFARSICGEGFPDFYAKQVVGTNPTCLGPAMDRWMAPIFEKLGICMSMASYGYTLDENNDPLIPEC
jgi:hypothetical protein